MPKLLPHLYVVADNETLRHHAVSLQDFARQLRRAGVTLVQLRDKQPRSRMPDAAILRDELPQATLILNDESEDISCFKADGVHLGQTDSPIAEARAVLGSKAIIGLSTHTDDQVIAADQTTADYLAIGPVFATSTKRDAAPVVGLEGVRRARALTTKPLVAIGGITRQNCRSVLDAGADSVAVISALFAPGETVEEVARDFLRILR